MTQQQTIRLKLKLFARYREELGFAEIDLAIPVAITTVQQLLEWLLQTKPSWSEVLQAKDKLVAVNQELVVAAARLSDGDEVALLPPVTGG